MIEAVIIGHDHKNGREGQVTLNNPSDRPIGLMTYTEPFSVRIPKARLFLNDDVGSAMNQNVSFSGTPELVHDGTDTASWTGAIVKGTWDLSDTTNPKAGSNCVSLTGGENSDETTYDDGTTTDIGSYTALTGQMRLETYNGALNSILLSFNLAGVPVGNAVDLNDYINTGTLDSYQGFVIPKASFGLSGQTIDAMQMILSRSGGPKPTFRFDQLQWEASGDPVVFTATTSVGTRFYINEIRVSLADNITSIVTGSSTAYPTMPGLAYDAILGVTALGNGVVFTSIQGGEVSFSATLRQLGDFIGVGLDLVSAISDGTNTHIVLSIKFPDPIILVGDTKDKLTFTISDDLSGLLQFIAIARGAIEV